MMYDLGCILLILLFFLSAESLMHHRNIRKIKFRIHVNGTRGKSSVTRLIAAGLRAGGFRTCAKTTGTQARFIDPDGHEELIARAGKPNVIEQVRVVRRAVQLQADVLVLECMAVQPLLQALSQSQLIDATQLVITNIRPDHLDVMGPDLVDAARAFAGTMPVYGACWTLESPHHCIFQMAAEDRHSTLHTVSQAQVQSIGSDILKRFSYTEYAENLALALSVCGSLGVSRTVALEGMWRALPDPGALVAYRLVLEQNKELIFIHAFAANDPESTDRIRLHFEPYFPHTVHRVVLMNCRADRKERSIQLAETMAQWTHWSRVLAIGNGTRAFLTALKSKKSSLLAEDGAHASVSDIMHWIVQDPAHTRYLILCVGNIAGIGAQIVDCVQKEGCIWNP